MTSADRLARTALLCIAVATMVTGATQIVAPSFVLGIMRAEATPTTAHFFGTLGMFMVLFGGVMWNALRARPEQPLLLFWAALQKLGAFAAIAIMVQRGILAPLGWAVAVFDLFTGVLALWYWNRMRGRA